MQFDIAKIKEAAWAAYQSLFGERIARTTFVIRVAILGATIFIFGAPLEMFLSTSSRLLQDAYRAAFVLMLALCVLGFVSAYVKRLHDIGLRGFWAILFLVAWPIAIISAGGEYQSYRYEQDRAFGTSELNDIIGFLTLAAPMVVALWRGNRNENRFGPVPEPIEHITASRFNLAAISGALLILIPTSIYAGLFQSGVWVGRGASLSPMPTIDSNSSGRLLAKCWNIKGVGAGTGEGPLGGVYRDGYEGSVFDFVVSDDGQLDIVPAGNTFSKAYRADGFEIYAYGLKETDASIEVGDQSRFMIAAVYDGSRSPDGNVNFTIFSFAKTGQIWTEWQVVMSTGMSLGDGGFNLLLGQKEQARGRLMIGDCIVN